MSNPRNPRDTSLADVDAGLAAVLDGALRRALPLPTLPTSFRAGLAAAVRRSGEPDSRASRRSLADEYRQQSAALHAGYLRLQWRTLGTLLGVAFVAGIGLTLALPEILARFGYRGLLAVAAGGALAGVFIGARSWLRRSSLWNS